MGEASPVKERRRRTGLRWDALGLVVLLGLASLIGLRLAASRSLDWGAEGLPVLPGTAEETVNAFLDALARNDPSSAAALFTSHYGGTPDEAALAKLAEVINQAGGLTRWLLVSRKEGDPVHITVYTRLARAGDLVLTVEVFGDAIGWRVGNLHMGDGPPLARLATTWETASTPRLRLHATLSVAPRDLPLLVNRGEEALELALRLLTGASAGELVSQDRPVDIYVHESLTSLSAAVGRPVPDTVRGFWHGGAVHLVTQGPNTRDGQPLLLELLIHELNHGMLARYVQARARQQVRIPAWLGEGMAGVAARQLTAERRAHFANAAAGMRLPSLADLVGQFAGDSAQFRYELSFALCEYLCGRFGLDTLQRIVDGMCDGMGPDTALEAASGQELTALMADWHAWLRGGLVW
jgi:hypothetical protein